jgi:DNA-binding transcriptional ArsR family regulator
VHTAVARHGQVATEWLVIVADLVKPITNIDDPRYVKALAHPLRIRILAMLAERRASPTQLAKLLDIPVGKVSYHVRTLHGLGVIKLDSTRQARGAVERFYVATDPPRFSDDAWGRLDAIGKQRMLSAMLGQIADYVNGSAAAGGFDRADAHFTRTGLRLDEKGFQQLAAAMTKWLGEADRIQESARKRLAKVPHPEDDVVQTGLVLLGFEAVPFSDRPGSTAKRKARRAT